MAAKKIYLAGFEVFRADAIAFGEHLCALCARYGFQGLYPLDNAMPPGLSGRPLAEAIYRANLDLIHRADLIMANVNAFRGAEPDSGTAFEIGYATALGKPVWAYTDDAGPLVARLAVGVDSGSDAGIAKSAGADAGIATGKRAARHVDAQGYTVEDFGLNLNLMLACAATVVIGDAQACLARIAAG